MGPTMTWPDTPGGQGQPGVFTYFDASVGLIEFLEASFFLTGRHLTLC